MNFEERVTVFFNTTEIAVKRTVGIAGLLATVIGATAMAQQTRNADFGKREFDDNCAVCHATSGKGGGPYVELLKKSPPDLTTLTQRNGGVFPMARIYDVIEGAGPGHGARDMPIWGKTYSIKAAEYYLDVPYDQEAFVRARILGLAEYISRLQAK
jgi:mono/diheme cytochrome c family protein